MDLHVKKFTVRYQGKDYGPGSVIYGVEQDLASRLIAGSNGTIAALPDRETASPPSPANKGEQGNSKTDSVDEKVEKVAANDLPGLPAVDPKKTVK